MNLIQTLTPALIVEELNDLDQWVRDSYVRRLPTLDMANIWHMPDNDAISMYSLVYRAPNNQSHINTDWFLIDPYADSIVRYTEQWRLYQAVRPISGRCEMLWKRNDTWYTMASSAYTFNIKRHHVTSYMINQGAV